MVSVSAAWTGSAFAKVYSIPKHNIEDQNIMRVKEGFEAVPELLPNRVAKAWDSVFVLYTETASRIQYGTTFLVKTIMNDTDADLYFLTNAHVANDVCLNEGCPNSVLKQNINLSVNTKNQLSDNEIRTIVLKNVSVVHALINPDLALLKVTVNKNFAAKLTQLPLSSSCSVQLRQSLYTIGFSDTSLRNDPHSKPIYNKNTIVKRWSEGVFTGYNKSNGQDPRGIQYWIGTSIDVLSGGSGGPILNEYGEVVGVIQQSASVSENKYVYDGNEKPDSLDWQSNGVRCEFLKDFIDRSVNRSQN